MNEVQVSDELGGVACLVNHTDDTRLQHPQSAVQPRRALNAGPAGASHSFAVLARRGLQRAGMLLIEL